MKLETTFKNSSYFILLILTSFSLLACSTSSNKRDQYDVCIIDEIQRVRDLLSDLGSGQGYIINGVKIGKDDTGNDALIRSAVESNCVDLLR